MGCCTHIGHPNHCKETVHAASDCATAPRNRIMNTKLLQCCRFALSWCSCGVLVAFLWCSCGVVVFLWRCGVVVFLWRSCGVVLFLCRFCGLPVVCLWCCGVLVLFLWSFYGLVVVLLWCSVWHSPLVHSTIICALFRSYSTSLKLTPRAPLPKARQKPCDLWLLTSPCEMSVSILEVLQLLLLAGLLNNSSVLP